MKAIGRLIIAALVCAFSISISNAATVTIVQHASCDCNGEITFTTHLDVCGGNLMGFAFVL